MKLIATCSSCIARYFVTDVVALDESVAVVVTTYNDPDSLREALLSVIVQQHRAAAVYVVDDGSQVLKPGGIRLLTVPGISPIDRKEWATQWYWGFTPLWVRLLFQRRFSQDAMTIEAHGNVFAATAFIQGATLEEVGRAKLDVFDPAFPVTITLRARKG